MTARLRAPPLVTSGGVVEGAPRAEDAAPSHRRPMKATTTAVAEQAWYGAEGHTARGARQRGKGGRQGRMGRRRRNGLGRLASHVLLRSQVVASSPGSHENIFSASMGWNLSNLSLAFTEDLRYSGPFADGWDPSSRGEALMYGCPKSSLREPYPLLAALTGYVPADKPMLRTDNYRSINVHIHLSSRTSLRDVAV